MIQWCKILYVKSWQIRDRSDKRQRDINNSFKCANSIKLINWILELAEHGDAGWLATNESRFATSFFSNSGGNSNCRNSSRPWCNHNHGDGKWEGRHGGTVLPSFRNTLNSEMSMGASNQTCHRKRLRYLQLAICLKPPCIYVAFFNHIQSPNLFRSSCQAAECKQLTLLPLYLLQRLPSGRGWVHRSSSGAFLAINRVAFQNAATPNTIRT